MSYNDTIFLSRDQNKIVDGKIIMSTKMYGRDSLQL